MSIKQVYYNQKDPRWVNYPYPAPGYESATIGSGGCAPTCGAMVVSSARDTITPDDMGDISRENGFRVSGGTRAELFDYIADRWSLEYQRPHSSYEAFDLCQNNWFVVILCGQGLWTTSGHYILAVGTRGDQIQIFDPGLYDGKFNSASRRGKVSVEGVSCFCQIDTFKRYSNAQSFYAFHIPEPLPPEPDITVDEYTNMSLYGDMYIDLRQAFGNDQAKLREHFNTWGIHEDRIASYVFDKKVYFDRYEDIRNAIGGNGPELYNHFANNGITEHRTGGLLYDPELYFNIYKDLQQSFGGGRYRSLMHHFLYNGIHENRISSYVFDPVYYYAKYPDLRNAFKKAKKDSQCLYEHYLTNGIAEGRAGSIIFDVKYYKEINKDLQHLTNYEACMHFIDNGIKEGRVTSKEFDVRKYREYNPDLNQAFGDNWAEYYKHFLIFGRNEDRKYN